MTTTAYHIAFALLAVLGIYFTVVAPAIAEFHQCLDSVSVVTADGSAQAQLSCGKGN